ncbi:MAG: hypothetical protein D6754_06920, partial [Alphaproteobacteria bacterium]
PAPARPAPAEAALHPAPARPARRAPDGPDAPAEAKSPRPAGNAAPSAIITAAAPAPLPARPEQPLPGRRLAPEEADAPDAASGRDPALGTLAHRGAGPGAEAAPHAPRTPPAPPDAQHIARQIGAAIDRAADGRVELRLDPPELGRVRLSLSGGEHHVSALITAERPETLDLMRRHADLLQRELQAAGYSGAELRFAGGGADRRAPGQPLPAPASTAVTAAAEAASDTPAPARPRSGAGEGLDLRL